MTNRTLPSSLWLNVPILFPHMITNPIKTTKATYRSIFPDEYTLKSQFLKWVKGDRAALQIYNCPKTNSIAFTLINYSIKSCTLGRTSIKCICVLNSDWKSLRIWYCIQLVIDSQAKSVRAGITELISKKATLTQVICNSNKGKSSKSARISYLKPHRWKRTPLFISHRLSSLSPKDYLGNVTDP